MYEWKGRLRLRLIKNPNTKTYSLIFEALEEFDSPTIRFRIPKDVIVNAFMDIAMAEHEGYKDVMGNIIITRLDNERETDWR